jgi:hypothetical protein
MKTLRRVVVVVVVLAVAGVVTLAAMSGYYGGSDGSGCVRCHEIRPMANDWAWSAHRNVGCADCHGSSFTASVRMHVKNLNRMWLHRRGEVPPQIRLGHEDVGPVVARCGSCHAQQHADWQSGPHGVQYARIFLDEEHNTSRQLMDDCLRCHGMHYDGGIRDLVLPLDRKGPWQLIDAVMHDEPAIPCLACHAIHTPGDPVSSREKRASLPGVEQELMTPSLAFFDRRGAEPVPVSYLPMPRIMDGERPVEVSPDPRQALCYQCHAPREGVALFQAFSGDDRTPTGVHEGLSCLACHARHDMTTRVSCAGCHPRLSNCGIDVEKMDTTFRSLESPHNIHRVSCEDCHPRGVPKTREEPRSDVASSSLD